MSDLVAVGILNTMTLVLWLRIKAKGSSWERSSFCTFLRGLIVLGAQLGRLRATWVDAITVRPEDDIRTQGVEDGMVTPGASEDPYQSVDWTALVPTSTKSTVTRIEDLPTSESTVHAQEESQSTTASNMATSHSMDGLATGTLIGITVGVLLAIGFIGGIIIVVVRKMSGSGVISGDDGLATGTLIGITVGVLLAIGFIGGIIIVVVRKMSGRSHVGRLRPSLSILWVLSELRFLSPVDWFTLCFQD
ncbi:Podoplanin [Pteropus alecto]|uniref:Podoplanin n=1 Tax=Pteropus alecto TaxID=9402 RepID=L5KJ06_PTEAL|nr:Podoplanin [Pteropus alecto]